MKSQLLQDINESASRSRSRLLGDTPSPGTDGGAAAPPTVERSGPEVRQAQKSDPGPAESDVPAFASERIDWLGGQKVPDRFDRWGRRAAIWGTGLAVASLISGGGLWLHRENSIDSTLVLVAKNSLPTRQRAALVAAPAPAPAMAAGAQPDVLPKEAAPLEAMTQAAPPAAAVPSAVEPSAASAAAAPSDQKPVLATPSQPVASKALKREKKPASARSRRKAPASPVVSEATRRRQLVGTLRACRAMGYHAAECLKRDCAATKYGLACKG
jgi:hypothetical protein